MRCFASTANLDTCANFLSQLFLLGGSGQPGSLRKPLGYSPFHHLPPPYYLTCAVLQLYWHPEIRLLSLCRRRPRRLHQSLGTGIIGIKQYSKWPLPKTLAAGLHVLTVSLTYRQRFFIIGPIISLVWQSCVCHSVHFMVSMEVAEWFHRRNFAYVPFSGNYAAQNYFPPSNNSNIPTQAGFRQGGDIGDSRKRPGSSADHCRGAEVCLACEIETNSMISLSAWLLSDYRPVTPVAIFDDSKFDIKSFL